MRRYKSKLKIRTGVDLVAMTDIVFLLLMYFLLNSTIGKNPVVKISLPKSISAKAETTQSLIIQIDEANKIYLDGAAVELSDLSAKLKGHVKSDSETPVIIKGDKAASYQTIISVMDKVNQAGVTNFNLATEK